MSRQRSSRLEKRAEREARLPSAAPRARRQRQKGGRSGGARHGFLPGPLGRMSGTALALSIGGIVLVLALVYAVTQTGSEPATSDAVDAQLNDDPSLPGVYFPPHPGPDGEFGTTDDRQHYATGTIIPICSAAQLAAGNYINPLCYTSNPPTSGPHADRPMQFAPLENPAPKENLIHNMEHGGVVIWYNTTDQAVIDQIKDLVKDQNDRRRFVVSSFYGDMEPETIAITAWTRLDKFPVAEYDKKRLEDFIDEHHKRFNPEGF